MKTTGSHAGFKVRWHSSAPGATYTVQERAGHSGSWHTLRAHTSAKRLTFKGAARRSYQFRVRAISGIGVKGRWRNRTVHVVHV